jgi:NADPH:quinone reductase-like Zn-dependent oxidoreductase
MVVKAIVQTRFGSPTEVLELREIEQPVPEHAQVLVRVRAASVAKGDWLIARGEPYIARPSYGFKTPKHHIAGLEVAGLVEDLGPGVERWQRGDEVFGWCSGAFAEFVAVGEDQLARKPFSVTFEEAAAVPISGFAALQAVRDCAQVRSGHEVLILGASGGVGSLAVQIAKTLGADVTGVASTRNLELVRSLGADHVLDYTREEIAGGGRTYDVIIDIAGNRPLFELRKALNPSGTLVIVGGTGGSTTMGFGRTVRAMMLSPFVRQRLLSLLSKPNLADLETLGELLATRRIRTVVDQTYRLSEAPSAVEQIGAGRSGGKRVIRV